MGATPHGSRTVRPSLLPNLPPTPFSNPRGENLINKLCDGQKGTQKMGFCWVSASPERWREPVRGREVLILSQLADGLSVCWPKVPIEIPIKRSNQKKSCGAEEILPSFIKF